MVLVADVGTQRLKVMVFSKEGNLLGIESEVYPQPYFSSKPGWAEQHAEYYWRTFLNLSGKLLNRLSVEVEAVSVTTQRNSLVLVDENGTPLRPVILWLDHRRADFDLRFPPLEVFVYKIAGMWKPLVSVYKDAKINWIRQNEPGVWSKTHKVLQLSGYFNHELTGVFVDSIASQIGHIPFDYKRRKWAEERDLKSKLFPIDKEKLPEIVEAGTVIGKLRKEVAEELGIGRIPVIASGSDKGCETIGLGVIDESFASLSFGTTATVQTTTPRYFEPLRYLPPYPSLVPGKYNPEVEIFRGFWLVKWFESEFGHVEKELSKKNGQPVEEILDELLDLSPPGSMGLVTQPFWTPGLKMPEARGAIIGFSSFHKREHVYRSLIEGIIFALREGLERIEKAGRLKFEGAMVAGGASRSDRICQMTADILNLPVMREKTGEAAGLGAAMAAYVGLGVYGNLEEAVEGMVSHTDVFEPDRENASLYEEIYSEVYKKLYGRLKKLYSKMEKLHEHFTSLWNL